jgi:hypothetical protein
MVVSMSPLFIAKARSVLIEAMFVLIVRAIWISVEISSVTLTGKDNQASPMPIIG